MSKTNGVIGDGKPVRATGFWLSWPAIPCFGVGGVRNRE